MANRKKILFVTYSVSLIYNWVVKLIPYLFDCEVLVLHIRKLENVSLSQKIPVSNIDITGFSYRRISNIIDKYNPSICVFFNFKGIIEQLLLRICKEKCIKTLYLEHGIITNDVITFKKLKLAHLSKRFKRVFIQLYQYLSFILRSNNPLYEARLLYKTLRHNIFSLSTFDYYFVFGHRCMKFLSKIFPLKENRNAFIVGYPLFESSKQRNEATAKEEQKKLGVLYIHQPFIRDQYTTISYEKERAYLMKWAEKLVPEFGVFTILLHPREDLNYYRALYNKTNIKVIQSPNNYLIFKQSRLVLGHYSTALLYPLYFNIPTYIIEYPHVAMPSIFENIFPSLAFRDTIMLEDTHEYPNKNYLIGMHNTFENIAKMILDRT